MASKRRPVHQRPRRLGWATALLAVAAIILFALFDGVVFRATQGAGIGLYATVIVLMVGFACAATAVVLAGRAAFRPRRADIDIVKLADRRKEDRKAA